jgi:hypothetical protein
MNRVSRYFSFLDRSRESHGELPRKKEGSYVNSHRCQHMFVIRLPYDRFNIYP